MENFFLPVLNSELKFAKHKFLSFSINTIMISGLNSQIIYLCTYFYIYLRCIDVFQSRNFTFVFDLWNLPVTYLLKWHNISQPVFLFLVHPNPSKPTSSCPWMKWLVFKTNKQKILKLKSLRLNLPVLITAM